LFISQFYEKNNIKIPFSKLEKKIPRLTLKKRSQMLSGLGNAAANLPL
jgi:hypothetical protein